MAGPRTEKEAESTSKPATRKSKNTASHNVKRVAAQKSGCGGSFFTTEQTGCSLQTGQRRKQQEAPMRQATR